MLEPSDRARDLAGDEGWELLVRRQRFAEGHDGEDEAPTAGQLDDGRIMAGLAAPAGLRPETRARRKPSPRNPV